MNKIVRGLRHDFPKDNFVHLISLTCPCTPKVLSGAYNGISGYQIFDDEWTVVHRGMT